MAQTQEEVDAIIDSLIIDNTTRQVDPAKVRTVLHAINARVPASSDPSVLVATPPLVLDEFTNALSIPQSNESTSGYISDVDFKKFNMGVDPVVSGDFRLVAKAPGNVDRPVIELKDICLSFRSDNTDGIPDAGTFGFFQYIDAELNDQDPDAYTPVSVTLVNVT